MRDQFAFDVGDFGKIGLLRSLCAGLSLAVIWCLASGVTSGNDGKHIGYLNPTPKNLKSFRACDPALYDALRVLAAQGPRSVAAPSALLPPGTVSVLDPVPAFIRDRRRWFEQVLEATATCAVVFLDPTTASRRRLDGPGCRSSTCSSRRSRGSSPAVSQS